MSFILFTNREKPSGPVVELRLKIKGSQVQDSPVALSCDLGLDTLSFG